MIRYFDDMVQGSPEWFAARCGLLTASEMRLIITPTLKAASNEKERSHLFELLAQRITGYVEPTYVSNDMLRGCQDEIDARTLYAEKVAPGRVVGFVTNDELGFTLGCSPDGLVGDDGLIEVKGRRQKFQVETIISQKMPDDFRLQVQTSLLVTGRAWCDFISYSGGMPMVVIRVYPDSEVRDAIVAAAIAFEERLQLGLEAYRAVMVSGCRLFPTERRIEQEITL